MELMSDDDTSGKNKGSGDWASEWNNEISASVDKWYDDRIRIVGIEVEGEDEDHQQDASTTLSGNFAIGDVSLSNLQTNSGQSDDINPVSSRQALAPNARYLIITVDEEETMHSDNEREVDSDGLSILESDGPGTISSQLVTILKRIITDD
nr:9869_t:CDS:2 [Entrophospora candida]